MSTTNGNLNNLKVTDPQGNVYVLVPVDTEARQAIEEAKELTFDEDYFTVEETDTEVNLGLNGVPIGVDDTTPLKIIQDDQEGFVLGADTLFTSSLIGSAFTEFSSAATYDVDQKVVHDSKLYNCTTAVSVAGEWSDSNWTEIPLIDLANQYTLSAIQNLATKEYVDSLVVSSISAAASIEYVSANYVNNTTFDAYSADIDSQLEALSADKLDKSYSATVNSLLDDKLNVSAFNAYSATVNAILITVDDKLDKTDFDAYSATVDTQLADKLDKSDFDTYSATVDTQLSNKLDTSAFNAYSATVDSQISDKLDTSAFDAYSANIDSRFDDKLDKTDFDTYSATVDTQLSDKLDKTDFDTYSATVDSQISDKLDISAFDAYSATVDERFDDKLDVSAMSAFDVEAYSGSENISVQDHIISLQNAKNLVGDGTSITVVETDAAFVVSAVKDFADKTFVISAVSGKLDQTDFDTYSATVANQFDAKLDTSAFDTYSADIDSQLSDKLNKSDFDTYSATIDSQLSDKLNTSDFDTYSAAVDSQIADKLDTSAFDTYSASIADQFDTKLDVSAVSAFDVIEYSGSDNVSVQDHIISIQNSKNLVGDGTAITVVETDAAFVISATKDFADKTYVTSAVSSKLNKTDFDTYSATVDSQLSDKLDTSAFDTYSADIDTQLSNKLDISDFNTYSAAIDNQFDTKLDVSAVSAFDVEAYSGSDNVSVQDHIISIQNSKNLVGDGTSITVVETDAAFVISATKDFADKTYVTSAVSGKLDTSDFNSYSAAVDSQISDKLDTSAFNSYSAAVDTQLADKVDTSAVSAKIDGIASPANLGGYAAPTAIMVVSAMPAAADIDPTTIYFVIGTMTGTGN